MSELITQPTKAPTRKVTAGGLGGAATILIVGILTRATGIEISPEEFGAITLFCTLAFSYLYREAT